MWCSPLYNFPHCLVIFSPLYWNILSSTLVSKGRKPNFTSCQNKIGLQSSSLMLPQNINMSRLCDHTSHTRRWVLRRQTGRCATYRFSFGHGNHFELVERIIGKEYPIPLRYSQNYISGFFSLPHGHQPSYWFRKEPAVTYTKFQVLVV